MSASRRCMTLLMAACLFPGCEEPEPRDRSQYYQSPDASTVAASGSARDASDAGGIAVAWFGHSLVQRPGDTPLDLPKLVAELHHAARSEGRTQIPERAPYVFTLLNRHLGHHLDGPGDAEAELRALSTAGVTHVVGIGFMHMLGEAMFERPTVSLWLGRLGVEGFDSPRRHTEHIYRFVELMRRYTPRASWVSYVGPALATNVVPQPAIDARYACIEQTVREAGVGAMSAHVGQAFRRAEAAARDRPELKVQLNTEDGLHLSQQGAVLAASVLYERIYGVDPTGLPVPARYRAALGDSDQARERVALFLQQVAHETTARYAPACDPAATLPEDERARARLTAP